MLGADLVSAAASRIESTLGLSTVHDAVDPAVWLRVDSYALVRAIVSIAARLKREGVRELRIALQPAGRRAHLDLAWSGAEVTTETLAGWEDQPLETNGESLPLTLKQVVERRRRRLVPGEPVLHDRLLPAGRPGDGGRAGPLVLAVTASGRPEYYDFDLFHQEGQTPTSTSGSSRIWPTPCSTPRPPLSPSDGDEIISIGAVRIVNGRLLHQEGFEQFVDPRRPVSLATVRITGIDPVLLAGKPPIDQVLPQFHRFCEDTVLVAHNGAFDMRFLQLKEAVAGVRFTHPVLDTMLLAAVIQPDLPPTGLEGIGSGSACPCSGGTPRSATRS